MKLTVLTSLLTLVGLSGCGTMAPGTRGAAPGVAIKGGVPALIAAAPVRTPAMSVSESMYAMARLAHGQGQLAMAAQRYERVLAMKPDHVGALNALGVIRAQEGRTAEALDLLVHARTLAPSAAHIHNNLGYALLRQDRLEDARASLQTARELDPGNERTLQNLDLLAQALTARDGVQVARAEVPAPMPGQEAPAQAPGTVSETAPATAPASAPVLVAVAPQVFELRVPSRPGEVPETTATVAATVVASQTRPQALQQPVAVQAAAVVVPADHQEPGYKLVVPSREQALQAGPFAIWTDIRGVKLEVSNGVGIAQLAKRTAVRLAETGVATTRLTNARPYQQARTQIQYLPGQLAAVNALAARLPVPVEQVQVPVGQLNAQVQLRLVLGHDVAGRAIASWIDGTRPTHLAQQAARNGLSS